MAGAPFLDSTHLEAQLDAPGKRPSGHAIFGGGNEGEGNDHDKENEEHEAAGYGDTSSAYWKLYGSEAEAHDKELTESLHGDTESMLIVNGLFSSIVASFIIETYKTLQPNNSQSTAGTQSPSPSSQNPNPQQFTSHSLAVRINILLFLSLFFSMMSGLASALIQQWCREFLRHAYPSVAPHKRGRVRTYLYQGLDQFKLRRFMHGVHVFLHVAVFLFFWALSDLLHNVDATVGAVARCCLWASMVVYTALSISPLIDGSSPYHTALTPPLQSGSMALLLLCHFIWRSLPRVPKWTLKQREYFKGLRFDRALFLLKAADEKAAQLDLYAMKWLFTDNDLSDIGMEDFLEGLPGYIHSRFKPTVTDNLLEILTWEYVLNRIREHFMTCATSLELSEEACITRVLTCVNSLRTIFKASTEQPLSKDKARLQEKYIREVVVGLNGLCNGPDPEVSLRASCVRGLAFQGLLTRLTESKGVLPPTRGFPNHLISLYEFFSSGGNTSGMRQGDSVNPSPEATSKQSPMVDDTKKWRALLYDGPLVNLTLLANAVVLHDDGDPSNLSLCRKTLDLLLKGLEFARTEVSDSAQAQFEEVHNQTRERVKAKGRGSIVTHLLDILDAVARGLRLSAVFPSHHDYRGRADAVFGKEHLRNVNLLEEFASHLPGFVSVDRDRAMRFMEELVREDDLWTSLQDNLRNALREDTPIPDKLRIFEACCTVLDQGFLALEDSQNVDWRAPEFGSLGQHFEMFIAHCFQGTFVGRATSFRVGIIKARFCRALLAQFFEEVDRSGTVVFRSQWDVASLARLFYTLGVGGEEDAKFWRSFIDGGHVGAGFMTKAHDTLKIAVRDGPLLNFCRLGRLAVTMIPFKGSGLNDTDVEKLMELLRGMVDDSRLPLKSASAEVWEDLGRLRDEADHVISNCCDGDKVKLRQLIEKVEQVYERRLSASQESGPSDHLRAPGSEPSAFAQPRLSSRELRLSHNRSSEATGSSTVVAEDRYEASPTRENDGESAIASNPYNADEIGSGGATAGPSADAAYIRPPVLGNVFLAPQGISPVPPSFQYARQHPVMPVDDHPTRSASTLSTPRSPRLGSRDPASAEATSPPGHPNAVDGAQSDASVVPTIY